MGRHPVVVFSVKTTCSYTSSDKITISVLRVSAASCLNQRGKIRPLGLCGVLTIIIRVRGVMAARTSSQLTLKSGTVSG